MLVVFLPVAWALVLLVAYDALGDWRAAFLAASLASGAAVVLSTESLTLLHAFAFPEVTLFWGGSCAVLFLLYVYRQRSRSGARLRRPHLDRTDALLGIGIVSVAALTGVTALLSPPNNWDSMSYHMARVAHWLQDRSVAYYPTHVLRQAYSLPGAEFIVANVQVLMRGDRGVNLVQWACFVGCIVGVSAIASTQGAGRRGQICAAVVAATIPMAILQASSTQTDLVVSFWLVSFAFFSLRLVKSARVRDSGAPWLDACAVGASLGLALLTKGTAWAFALPATLALIAYIAFAKSLGSWTRRAGCLAIIGLVVIGLNAGYLARNSQFGSPLTGGSDMPVTWSASLTSPTALLSSILRNASLQTTTLLPYSDKFVTWVHQELGISPSDPRTTLAKTTYAPTSLSNHEDLAANPIHFALCLLASVGVLGFATLRRRRLLLAHLLLLLSSALLYCLLFRWQPWGSRLVLPLFVLWAPLVGVVLEEVRPTMTAPLTRRLTVPAVGVVIVAAVLVVLAYRRQWPPVIADWSLAFAVALLVATLITLAVILIFLVSRRIFLQDWTVLLCIGLLLMSLPYAVANSTRPLIGRFSILGRDRMSVMFANTPQLLRPYEAAARFIRQSGPGDVGLITAESSYEYPLWALLGDPAGAGRRIEHIDVNNSTSAAGVPSKHFDPKLVFVVDADMGPSFHDRYGRFVRVRSFPVQGGTPVAIYKRAD